MNSASPEGKFPFGKENRKREIESKQKKIGKEQLLGTLFGITPRGYTLRDSPLEGHPSTFDGTFRRVLPEGETSLRGYIEKELASRKGKAVGIEFGGPGRELFAGFSEGFFQKTAGVPLVDPRRTVFSDAKAIDAERHHQIISGDILSEKTYERLNEWLDGDKADLILERMMAGWKNMPNEPFTVGKLFQRGYGLLGEGGLMFLEVPREWEPLATPWADYVKAYSKGTLDIQLGQAESAYPYGFRLNKKLGAPETLPLLDPRTVREISKKSFKEGV